MHTLALLALVFLPAPWFLQEAPAGAGLPLRVPEGWESRQEEGTRVLAPKDLGAGKLFAVLVPTLTRTVGSLKGLVDAGRETLGGVGTFRPTHEPVRAKNDAGWEYEILLGTIEKDGGAILGQIVALQKGSEEGLVLLVTDSVETWEKYSDAFAALIRSVGSDHAGKVDLDFTLPEGWTRKDQAGSILLEGSEQISGDVPTVFRVLILPSEPLAGSLREKYLDLWAALLKPAVETLLLPLPFMRRLESGMVCAFDMDEEAVNRGGTGMHAGLYVLARGKRIVPILTFHLDYAGVSPRLEREFAALLGSARIPDAGSDAIDLFAASDLEGEWSESSSSFANFVTSSGDYAGDASISTGSYMVLNKDRSFRTVLIAITRDRRIKETEEGQWKLDGDSLVLTGKETSRRYRLFAFGADPAVGAFLVRSTYSNGDELPDLSRPRRAFSGLWFKRKE